MDALVEKSNPFAYEFPAFSKSYTVHVDSFEFLDHVQIDVDIQRELDSLWIQELKNKITSDYDRKGFFYFNIFEVASLNNSLYLLDGQHRYFILKELQKSYNDIRVEVKIHIVSSKDELNNMWLLVNGSKPSKIYKSTSKQIIINCFKKHLLENYPKYISNSSKPMKPNINLNQLETAITKSRLIETLQIDSSDQLINLLEKLNNFYKYTFQSKWNKWNIPDETVSKCRLKDIMKPLYIGIYQNYEWITRIIEINKVNRKYDSYSSIPHVLINSNSRKVSKAKRRQIWEKRNKENSLKGRCYTCNREIDYDDFQAGHIVSHFYGGKLTLNNLEPICSPCNLDMGIENLNEYKRKFYQI